MLVSTVQVVEHLASSPRANTSVSELPHTVVSSVVVPLGMVAQGGSTGTGQVTVNAAEAEAPTVTVMLRGFSPSTVQLGATPSRAIE
jgi:hypothetical protein